MSWFKTALTIGIQAGLVSLFAVHHSQAGPVEGKRFESNDGRAIWYRLENRDVRLDFAQENSFQVDSVQLTGLADKDLAGIVEGSRKFWEDRINDGEVLSTLAELSNPKEAGQSARIEVSGGPVGTNRDKIRLTKTIRLFSEGAQFEVRYRLENVGAETLPVAYSVRTPWSLARDLADQTYYLPSASAVRKVEKADLASPIQIEGLEISAPWFAAASNDRELSCFFVSDQPFVSWKGKPEKDSAGTVETLVWEGTLKPGETREGTCWVAAVAGLGEPIAASGRYAAGVAWTPGYRFDSHCLETRFVGMPQGLKQFRIFSGVRRNSSSVAMVPVYTRRSKLSPTAVYSVLMPGSYEKGSLWLEQSIYSGSENVGYWNLSLTTPGKKGETATAAPSGPMTSLSYFLPSTGSEIPSKTANMFRVFRIRTPGPPNRGLPAPTKSRSWSGPPGREKISPHREPVPRFPLR